MTQILKCAICENPIAFAATYNPAFCHNCKRNIRKLFGENENPCPPVHKYPEGILSFKDNCENIAEYIPNTDYQFWVKNNLEYSRKIWQVQNGDEVLTVGDKVTHPTFSPLIITGFKIYKYNKLALEFTKGAIEIPDGDIKKYCPPLHKYGVIMTTDRYSDYIIEKHWQVTCESKELAAKIFQADYGMEIKIEDVYEVK